MDIYPLLKEMVERKASDLHITTGSPPKLRVNGSLVSIADSSLTPIETKELIYSILTESQKAKFEEESELDLSFGIKGLSRFRVNVFRQRGALSAVLRLIPFVIPTFDELGLPPIIKELIKKPKGLILVTGPTGSGKSTTLAAMIDKINEDNQGHIITIEDPIEYLHRHKGCLINQREINADTKDFKNALKYILRQDPDVVLIGEMRDLETIQAALTIAETGHLTLATLHTNSSVQTINRILSVFPPHQQQQIRVQLSFVLEGVLSQQLLPRIDEQSRCLALEIMIPNPAIRNLIREDKTHQIYSQMQVGQTKFAMQTMNQSLANLYQKGLISFDAILAASSEPDELQNLLLGANKIRSSSPFKSTGR